MDFTLMPKETQRDLLLLRLLKEKTNTKPPSLQNARTFIKALEDTNAGRLNQGQLIKATGLSVSTIKRLAQYLDSLVLVTDYGRGDASPNKNGRAGVTYQLNQINLAILTAKLQELNELEVMELLDGLARTTTRPKKLTTIPDGQPKILPETNIEDIKEFMFKKGRYVVSFPTDIQIYSRREDVPILENILWEMWVVRKLQTEGRLDYNSPVEQFCTLPLTNPNMKLREMPGLIFRKSGEAQQLYGTLASHLLLYARIAAYDNETLESASRNWLLNEIEVIGYEQYRDAGNYSDLLNNICQWLDLIA